MANPNVGEIVATTLRNRSGVIADNVAKNVALLFRLRKKGKIRTFAGGRTILQELSYQENSTFQWYSGLDTLNMGASNVLDAAEYNIKQAAIAVVISGLEELQNASKEQVIDLVQGRTEVAESTMLNNLATGIYSDGTGAGGKQVDGLQAQVADSPSTGTVGGINRVNFSFWRNLAKDATTDFSAAATSANMVSYMNKVYLPLVRGTDKPDLFPADNNYYELYLEALQPLQRFTSEDMAQAGFTSLKYMGGDVVLDGGQGGACPTNHMYFLNTSYIFWRPHSKRNMVPLPDRTAINQDAVVKYLAWAGNMTMSNASLQGVLKD